MRAFARTHGKTWQALKALLLPLALVLSVSLALSDRNSRRAA